MPGLRKKKSDHPDLDLSPPRPDTPLLGDLLPVLVGAHAGLVRSLTRFHKPPSEPPWPLIYRAELANSRFLSDKAEAFQVASGKGMDEAGAQVSALGEAVERYAGMAWASEAIHRCPRAELPDRALDPQRLVLYDDAQYAHLPYAPLQADSVLGWLPGRAFPSGQRVWVPAQPTLMAYTPALAEPDLCQVTSNGLAAGPTLAQAALRAALEVLERDAFVATWLLRLPCERVDPSSVPDAGVLRLVAAYARRGVQVELYRLFPRGAVQCFVGLGVALHEATLPAVVVGLGADPDPVRAAASAVLEIGQVRPGLAYRLKDEPVRAHRAALLADANRLKTLEDHDLYYAGHDTLAAFDFMRGAPTVAQDWQAAAALDGEAAVRALADHVAGQGSELVLVNLTPPDLAALGLYAARAFVPDFQPIYFGQHEQRLAHRRLAHLAAQHGLEVRINPHPHPLA